MKLNEVMHVEAWHVVGPWKLCETSGRWLVPEDLQTLTKLAADQARPSTQDFPDCAFRVQFMTCHSSSESDLTWIFLHEHKIASNSHLHGDEEFIFPRSCVSTLRKNKAFLNND